jgi:hypothetical protein
MKTMVRRDAESAKLSITGGDLLSAGPCYERALAPGTTPAAFVKFSAVGLVIQTTSPGVFVRPKRERMRSRSLSFNPNRKKRKR